MIEIGEVAALGAYIKTDDEGYRYVIVRGKRHYLDYYRRTRMSREARRHRSLMLREKLEATRRARAAFRRQHPTWYRKGPPAPPRWRWPDGPGGTAPHYPLLPHDHAAARIQAARDRAAERTAARRAAIDAARHRAAERRDERRSRARDWRTHRP